MRVVTIPEDCSRDEFMLCVKTSLKTLTPYGIALVILDDDTDIYDKREGDATHRYCICSDSLPPRMLSHGQRVNLIAIENPRHFDKEGIREVLLAFDEKEDSILLVQERTKK